MTLREDERMITNPFAVSGVIVFTVFDPDVSGRPDRVPHLLAHRPQP